MVETTKNIQRNPNVALAIWNKDWKENCLGYELRGKAEYFTNSKWYEMIKQISENKGESCVGAILIIINKIKKINLKYEFYSCLYYKSNKKRG